MTQTAKEVLSCVETLLDGKGTLDRTHVQREASGSAACNLPSPDVVGAALPRLCEAVISMDRTGIATALEQMGVLALCPPIDEMFARLEFSVGCVIGRARLIPLVELAIFAEALGAYDRASKYAAEGRALVPRPPEIHDLLTGEGAIALNAGNIIEAKGTLLESVRVCSEDDYACVACGARAFNVILAERLLQHGEREAVVKYLIECQRVWPHQASQISSWVQAIHAGQKPDFLKPGFLRAMNSPRVKLRALAIRGSLLGETLDAGS